jgi:hemerythrin-like domain-containing protein
MALRHKSLIPLSQDHYQGLLLAQQIRTTDRVMIAGWSSDPKEQARFVAAFFRDHLVNHFEAEEKSLFPLILQYVPSAEDRITELQREHRQLKDFAERFGNSTAEEPERHLQQFSELLDAHIRKEERDLFPLFEAQAPADVLEQAGQLLHRHYPDQSSASQ